MFKNGTQGWNKGVNNPNLLKGESRKWLEGNFKKFLYDFDNWRKFCVQ